MKKNLVFAVILISATLPIFAEKEINFKNGITISGFATVTPPSIQGSGVEFGFGLIRTNNFYMRNHIELSVAYQGKETFFYGIRERIIVGGHFSINDAVAIRPYGIFEFGFLMFRMIDVSGTKNAFEYPFILEPRGGFGTEFVFYKSGCIFIELLGGERILTNGKRFSDEYENLSDTHVSINIGARWYIN